MTADDPACMDLSFVEFDLPSDGPREDYFEDKYSSLVQLIEGSEEKTSFFTRRGVVVGAWAENLKGDFLFFLFSLGSSSYRFNSASYPRDRVYSATLRRCKISRVRESL